MAMKCVWCKKKKKNFILSLKHSELESTNQSVKHTITTNLNANKICLKMSV